MKIMKESREQILRLALHIALGSTIYFLTALLLRTFLFRGLYILFEYFNCVGVGAFNEALLAITLITLGAVYIPSGFCGGLYTGHKVKENLKVILIFPAIVGSVILLIILNVFFGYIITYQSWIEYEVNIPVFMPVLGSMVGTYLGGYTMNWKRLMIERGAKPLELPEEIEETLELTKIRGIGPKRAEKLRAAGVKTIKDLAESSAEKLSVETGIPEKTLTELIKRAKEHLGS
ncbi:helix-hairpin-helix domain-containing protein [Candidatus Bathyarchaeota archaeon]|nr:MAG: helix-hairpin-helix domain-containing protein [Candidatus Bathyarchaeota archaeon]RLG94240.1 MAG: hypothetical protein DRO29_06755 [Candidatus Bathyarchaeota archaeon]